LYCHNVQGKACARQASAMVTRNKEYRMDWAYELVCTGAANSADDVPAWSDAAGRAWSALPGLSALDFYRPIPEGANDPFNNDGPGPRFIAMLAFASREALSEAIQSPEFALSLGARPVGLSLTGSGFQRRFYPVANETAPGPLTAPFSYVVRYYKPAEDEAAFVRNYVDTHPPTLAKLPGIRSVMCYFPLAIMANDMAGAGYIIGNEVVFDDILAFNAAMQSPVRLELRQHFREFPPYSGLNTHFPMSRTRVMG
jgi:uncharacterized protein (TIGR02118 family)